METIKIAELSIDPKQLIDSLQKTKAEIDKLNESQKQMKKDGDTSSATFVRQEAELKKLRSEYGQDIKTLNAVTGATDKLTAGLDKEIKSIDDAVANNKELRKIRNSLNAETKEGAKQIKAINDKVNQNTDFIKDNSSALEQNKQNVGNYTESINKAKIGAKAFGGALKALGIGLIVAAVAKLSQAFGRNQKVMDKVNQVFEFVGIVFDKVVGSVVDAVTAANEATGGFDALGKVMGSLLTLVLTPIKGTFYGIKDAILSAQLGWEKSFFGDGDPKTIKELEKNLEANRVKLKEIGDSAKEAGTTLVDNFGEAFDEVSTVVNGVATAANDSLSNIDYAKAFDDAGAIARNKSSIEGLIIAQETLIQKYENQAEKLRQIRDDDTKTNAERLQASNDLLATLDKQGKAEQALLGLRLNAAQKELSLNKGNIELQNKVAEIKKEQADVENRIQTQYTEYQNSRRALDKEVAEDAIQLAKNSLTEYERLNQSKLDHDRYITDEQYRIEVDRLNRIAERRREFEAERLKQGVISEEEYNAAINEVNADNQEALDEAAIEKEEAEAEKDAVNEEIRVAKNAERSAYDLQFAQDELSKKHEAERKEVERLGGDLVALEEVQGKERENVARAVNQNKRDLASNTLGHLATIFGEETAAGKAAAVAQATIDTYSSAVSAFNSLSGIPIVGPVLGGIAAAAAVASGIATVKKITATPKPQAPKKVSAPKAESGMLIGGRRHSQGGTLIEAEQGEAIINRKSTAKYLPLLSRINSDNGSGIPFMATGGVVGGISLPASMVDYDLLASKVSEANRSLPSPRVGVDEISSVGNNINVIEQSAAF